MTDEQLQEMRSRIAELEQNESLLKKGGAIGNLTMIRCQTQTQIAGDLRCRFQVQAVWITGSDRARSHPLG